MFTNKKLSRFLSAFTLFALGFSFVEGCEKKLPEGKTVSQERKEYERKFSEELKLIFELPVFKSCAKYFKSENYNGEVQLNKDSIRNKSEFLDCFGTLVVFSGALSFDAKMFCLKLIDDLISYGNDKDNNIFKAENKNLKYYTHDGYKYCLKTSRLIHYIKTLECLDEYKNFRSINWLIWDIDNFLANHNTQKFVTPKKNDFTGKKRRIKLNYDHESSSPTEKKV